MDQEQAIAVVLKFLAHLRRTGYEIEAAFLFGSVARGTASVDSDIDIAIILKEMDNSFDTQVELMKLRRSIDFRIEPHPFLSLDTLDPSGFLAEIKRTGIRVA